MCDDITPRDVRTEDQRLSPEEEEAIVVGAVGSAAPWFLTGLIRDARSQSWLHQCLNECVLRPCERRLVSADSSPLSVKGEIELTNVFPGLSCHMLLVVANIGSDGLMGTEAL